MKMFTQGLFFGLGVGGIIGLLNTPHSGTENRRRLQEYMNENKESVNELSGSLKGLQQSITNLSDQGMAVADAATKDLTESLTEFSQKNSPRIKRTVDSLSKLTEDAKKEANKYKNSPLLNKQEK